MLKSLKIKNVALIDEAEIFFGEGLNVLSGETGAGKSVIMECVNFALGQKADKSMISEGASSCSVSCEFDVGTNLKAKEELAAMDIELDDTLVVKRSFSLDGRGGIRLNGEPVSAQMLRRVTSCLVDVHGQSDHFALLKEQNQLGLIDSLAGEPLRLLKASVKEKLDVIKQKTELLSKVGGTGEDREKRLDYLDYCILEIERVAFKSGEDEELLQRKKKLLNAEKIMSGVTEALTTLTGEGGAADCVAAASRSVSSIEAYADELSGVADRLSNCLEELNDISELLSRSVDCEFNERDLDEIESRLDGIGSLKRKYGKTYEEIEKTRLSFVEEKQTLIDSDEIVERLLKEISDLDCELNALYEKISEERLAAAKGLQEKLVSRLRCLGMPNADFAVNFAKNSEKRPLNGRDEVSFAFSANKGESLKPLTKIISGGELSRLMLGVKAVTAADGDDYTFIFDEIDSGISGAAAKIVAENLALIAADRQIIAISHLSQVIAMADRSLLIKKSEKGEKTRTEIFPLGEEERVREVLRAVGGDEGSESALLHARELLAEAAAFKRQARKV